MKVNQFVALLYIITIISCGEKVDRDQHPKLKELYEHTNNKIKIPPFLGS